MGLVLGEGQAQEEVDLAGCPEHTTCWSTLFLLTEYFIFLVTETSEAQKMSPLVWDNDTFI